MRLASKSRPGCGARARRGYEPRAAEEEAPEDLSPWAGFAPWPRAWCCRFRWSYDVRRFLGRTGCCRRGCSSCWQRRCSSSWARVSTGRLACGKALSGNMTCWWPSVPPRVGPVDGGCGSAREAATCISKLRPWWSRGAAWQMAGGAWQAADHGGGSARCMTAAGDRACAGRAGGEMDVPIAEVLAGDGWSCGRASASPPTA